MINLYVKKLHKDSILPEKKTTHAANYDVCAYIDRTVKIKGYNKHNVEFVQSPYFANGADNILSGPHERLLIPTGIKVGCDIGYKIEVYPRSGDSLKLGLTLTNCVGQIDVDYKNELFVILHNTSSQTLEVGHGDRIAQISVVRCEDTDIVLVDELPEIDSDRIGGFGSTGK